MGKPINPYVTGNPVDDDLHFVGRDSFIRDLIALLDDPDEKAILLQGQRRIGKTSIVKRLQATLPLQKYKTIYLNMHDRGTSSFSNLLRYLLREIAGTMGLPDLQSGEMSAAQFRESFLPNVIDQINPGSSLILFMDEFDVLVNPEQDQSALEFFPFLRQLIDEVPKVKFVFVIGRNKDLLDNLYHVVFDATHPVMVSYLSKVDTERLVRISEANRSLSWNEESIQAIYELTHGHPFFIQSICAWIWNKTRRMTLDSVPVASLDDVEESTNRTLIEANSILADVWKSLPLNARLTVSALAGESSIVTPRENPIALYNRIGSGVSRNDLHTAIELLEGLEILHTTDGILCFQVPLFKMWVAHQQPFLKVKEEIRDEPAAERLYRAAESLVREERLEEAINSLKQALDVTPNYTSANKLLIELRLKRGDTDQALEMLANVYPEQPGIYRATYVRALEQKIESIQDLDERHDVYRKILEIDPNHETAKRKNIEITLIKNQYEGGVNAIEIGDFTTAQALLKEVVAYDPTYKDAVTWLHKAVDPKFMQLQKDFEKASSRVQELEQQQYSVPSYQASNQKIQIKPVSGTTSQPGSSWSALNPIFYVAVAFYSIFTPSDLMTEEKTIGKWLANLFTWLPFGIVLLGIGLNSYITGEDLGMLIPLSIVVFIFWLFAGLFGDQEGIIDVTMAITGFIFYLILIIFILHSHISLLILLAGTLTIIVSCSVALKIAIEFDFETLISLAVIQLVIVVSAAAFYLGTLLGASVPQFTSLDEINLIVLGVTSGVLMGICVVLFVGVPSTYLIGLSDTTSYNATGEETRGVLVISTYVAILLNIGLIFTLTNIFTLIIAGIVALIIGYLVYLVVSHRSSSEYGIVAGVLTSPVGFLLSVGGYYLIVHKEIVLAVVVGFAFALFMFAVLSISIGGLFLFHDRLYSKRPLLLGVSILLYLLLAYGVLIASLLLFDNQAPISNLFYRLSIW